MEKRILCLFLVFMLCMTASFLPVLAEESSVEPMPEAELQELINTGILSPETAVPNTAVTRREMAELLENILGFNVENGSFEEKFSDVSAGEDGYHAIMAMEQLGYIRGYEDGTFRPAQFITGIEAAKILIHVLGYPYKAVLNGGFPTGYYACASEIGLSKGVKLSDTEPLSWSGMVLLLYNAVDIPLVEITAVGEKDEKYKIDPNVTILTRYKKMQRDKGVVTANDLVGLKGDSACGENQIAIDGMVYTVSDGKERGFLGRQVTFVYRLDDDREAHQLVSLVERETNCVRFCLDQFIRTEKNSIYFYNEQLEKEQKITFDIKADFIRNGELAVFSDALFSGGRLGEVEFVCAEGSVYDTVFIWDYNIMKVGSIDRDRMILTDAYDASKKLNLNDEDKIVAIYAEDGSSVVFPYITVSNIVRYAENSNYVEVHVGGRSVSGEVETVYEDGDDQYVTINGEAYKVNSLKKDMIKNLKAGDRIKGLLDSSGLLADITIQAKNGMELMYLIALTTMGGDLEGKVLAKLFDENGAMCVYTLADPLRINGKSIKNLTEDKVMEALNSKLNQLLQVKRTEDGFLTEIDTAKSLTVLEENNEDGFCLTHAEKSRYLYADPYNFDGSILMTNDTKIMVIPTDVVAAQDKDFRLVAPSYLSCNTNYVCASYSLTKDYTTPDILIVRMETTGSSVPGFDLASRPSVVSSMKETMNESGDLVKRVTVLTKNGEEFFDIDELEPAVYTYTVGEETRTMSANELSVGDVIRYRSDAKDFVRRLEVYHDESEDLWIGPELTSRSGIFQTEVVRRTGNYIILDNWQSEEETYAVVDLNFNMLQQFTVIEQRDGREPYVRSGSRSEIEKGDRIILHSAWGQPLSIILYK